MKKFIYGHFLVTGLILHVFIPIYLLPGTFNLDSKTFAFLKSQTSGKFMFFLIMPYLIVVFWSYLYRMRTDQVKHKHVIGELEAANLRTELKYLRSQISPHFIFNVINALVFLARKRSELLEDSLIDLSKMLRYMLYDINDYRVRLDKEMDHLRTYINLQLLRFGDTISFNLLLKGRFEDYNIEPMLLIPFIENAFKHSADFVADSLIDVTVCVNDQTGILKMAVENSVNQTKKESPHIGGIGLINVQRRLMLLYPTAHQIEVSQTKNTYKVNLEINL